MCLTRRLNFSWKGKLSKKSLGGTFTQESFVKRTELLISPLFQKVNNKGLGGERKRKQKRVFFNWFFEKTGFFSPFLEKQEGRILVSKQKLELGDRKKVWFHRENLPKSVFNAKKIIQFDNFRLLGYVVWVFLHALETLFFGKFSQLGLTNCEFSIKMRETWRKVRFAGNLALFFAKCSINRVSWRIRTCKFCYHPKDFLHFVVLLNSLVSCITAWCKELRFWFYSPFLPLEIQNLNHEISFFKKNTGWTLRTTKNEGEWMDAFFFTKGRVGMSPVCKWGLHL